VGVLGTFTLQALIEDDGSDADVPYRLTNAVVVRFAD
jgi:hypothetical protein